VKRILFTPNEDGFGPSALTSYIVKELIKKKPDWHITIWNKSRYFYNVLLYKELIQKKRVFIERISNLIELKKENGILSIDKTLKNLNDYKKLSNNYPGIANIPEFDLVVDFGVPAAVKWAVKNNIKSISMFDHCWSKTFEMIFEYALKKNKESVAKIKGNWQELVNNIRDEEKNTQALVLFPKFITPLVFSNYWKKLIKAPICELKGVLGGKCSLNKAQIKEAFGLPMDGRTIFIQGGDTPSWDELLRKIVPQLAGKYKNKLEERKINILMYIPDRIKKTVEFNTIFHKKLKRIKEFPPLEGSTIQAILPVVDFMITRAGGGTVNDAVACRIPFACIEERSQSQVELILNECLSMGLTRRIKYDEFINHHFDKIITQLNESEQNIEMIDRIKMIPNQQEGVVVDKIIHLVEN